MHMIVGVESDERRRSTCFCTFGRGKIDRGVDSVYCRVPYLVIIYKFDLEIRVTVTGHKLQYAFSGKRLILVLAAYYITAAVHSKPNHAQYPDIRHVFTPFWTFIQPRFQMF
jgi:hypothetical protein